jgi:PHD/YefM family antitoxin component YafN of YafNO toxin-antitoxin module
MFCDRGTQGRGHWLFSFGLPDYNVDGDSRSSIPPTLPSIPAQGMTMASEPHVQYVSDDDGKEIAVIVPIDLWREIESERETAYLLKSEAMKKRLLEAKDRMGGISLDDARKKLGI